MDLGIMKDNNFDEIMNTPQLYTIEVWIEKIDINPEEEPAEDDEDEMTEKELRKSPGHESSLTSIKHLSRHSSTSTRKSGKNVRIKNKGKTRRKTNVRNKSQEMNHKSTYLIEPNTGDYILASGLKPLRIRFNILNIRDVTLMQLDFDKILQFKPDLKQKIDSAISSSKQTSSLKDSPIATPRTSKPHSPRGSKPHSPRDSKPHTPRTSKPHTPITSKPHSPRSSKPHSPITSKPHSRNHSKSNSRQNSKLHSRRSSKSHSPKSPKSYMQSSSNNPSPKRHKTSRTSPTISHKNKDIKKKNKRSSTTSRGGSARKTPRKKQELTSKSVLESAAAKLRSLYLAQLLSSFMKTRNADFVLHIDEVIEMLDDESFVPQDESSIKKGGCVTFTKTPMSVISSLQSGPIQLTIDRFGGRQEDEGDIVGHASIRFPSEWQETVYQTAMKPLMSPNTAKVSTEVPLLETTTNKTLGTLEYTLILTCHAGCVTSMAMPTYVGLRVSLAEAQKALCHKPMVRPNIDLYPLKRKALDDDYEQIFEARPAKGDLLY